MSRDALSEFAEELRQAYLKSLFEAAKSKDGLQVIVSAEDGPELHTIPIPTPWKYPTYTKDEMKRKAKR